ncbi:MAG TPA: phosphoribosyltransferase family protein, partial [Acetobacteraceae bacterium]|nr:phosphoribosyltransferase family protein [Acetobacteraceae bacterium]
MSISETSSSAAPHRTPPAPSLVRALDRAGAFETACAQLMQIALRDGRPDALIGIRTGGLVVAEAMASALDEPLPVLPLTSRRAGTAAKSRIKLLPKLLKHAPRPVVDRLRVAELRLLSQRRRRSVQQQHVDPQEAEAIRAYLTRLPPGRTALVVDDAVDSGVTLAAVLDALRQACRGD